MAEEYSLITIASGRQTQLCAMVQALIAALDELGAAAQPPHEVIVVSADATSELAPLLQSVSSPLHCPVTLLTLPAEAAKYLARARNLGARAAHASRLLFLDVDCLPSPALIAQMGRRVVPGLAMFEPRYLPANLTRLPYTPCMERAGARRLDWQLLDAQAQCNPHRPRHSQHPSLEANYALFWSLCFTIQATTFTTLGGFDEGYCGYGAEDTDFAFSAEQQGVPFYLLPAPAYHQQHPVYRPPLNHLESIVRNARYFRSKWGRWAMEGWLESFAELELVDWQPEGDRLEIIATPSQALLARCYYPDAPYS